MIEHRPFTKLGHADYGWLDARYHFSFSEYRDPLRNHWGALRVWNDDAILPGTGFPMHSHQDMEIITYVREGAITHEDSLGNRGRTAAGDVQVMSAGSGIQHSEYNHESVITRIFQIWIPPTERGLAPAWGTRPFPKKDRAGRWIVLASGMQGDGDALPIHTDARVLGASLTAGAELTYDFASSERYGYLVLAEGVVELEGLLMHKQDGAAIHGQASIRLRAREDAELILVETI